MEKIKNSIEESVLLHQDLLNDDLLLSRINELALVMANCLKNNGKIILCGNGGSASDALHFAGEIIGRFQKERSSWPAIVLNADVVTLTAIANDYGFDNVYSRQINAFLNPNDILLGISTSGNSINVYNAIIEGKKEGGITVGLLGNDGGLIGKEVDYPLIIKSKSVPRIQEMHILIIHIICNIIEEELNKN